MPSEREIAEIEAVLRRRLRPTRVLNVRHLWIGDYDLNSLAAEIAALRAKDREDGAWGIVPKLRTPLTDAEREFIAEMAHEDDGRSDRWQNFDPDFRQKDIARLLRLGWAERRERDGYREYRWTEAGRDALPLTPKESGDA